jgi:hypothetical protein
LTRYLAQLLLLVVLTVFGFGIYLLLFMAGAGASISILFYRGVVLGLVAAGATAIVAVFAARRTNDTALPVAAAAVSLSFNICFLVLLPVTVDRSVTVYLLSTIESRQGEGIDPPTLERKLIGNYVVGWRAVPRRLDEQRRSGNVTIGRDGKVRLTDQGERFMRLSRLVARLFETDPRFVDATQTQRTRR